MPLVWVSTKRGRTWEDLPVPGMPRLFVNACYWALGLDAKIKFGGNAKGITPASLAK